MRSANAIRDMSANHRTLGMSSEGREVGLGRQVER